MLVLVCLRVISLLLHSTQHSQQHSYQTNTHILSYRRQITQTHTARQWFPVNHKTSNQITLPPQRQTR